MRLNDVETVRLLPAWVREDKAVIGLGKGTDNVVKALFARIKLLSRWNKIDELEDAVLDEMAYELNIPWYDSTAPIATKREIIKKSDLVYSKLGTKYAIEQIISAYFGTGELQEWFDYGGEPFHFKILSDNPALVNENYELFLRLLNIAKRKSAHLDAILICLTGNLPLYAAAIPHEHTYERNVMGSGNIYLYSGAYTHERNVETVRLGADNQS